MRGSPPMSRKGWRGANVQTRTSSVKGEAGPNEPAHMIFSCSRRTCLAVNLKLAPPPPPPPPTPSPHTHTYTRTYIPLCQTIDTCIKFADSHFRVGKAAHAAYCNFSGHMLPASTSSLCLAKTPTMDEWGGNITCIVTPPPPKILHWYIAGRQATYDLYQPLPFVGFSMRGDL